MYGFEDVTRYDADLKSTKHAGYESCKWAIERVVTQGCPIGARWNDSQGGWWTWDDDGSSYGVDPTLETTSEKVLGTGE